MASMRYVLHSYHLLFICSMSFAYDPHSLGCNDHDRGFDGTTCLEFNSLYFNPFPGNQGDARRSIERRGVDVQLHRESHHFESSLLFCFSLVDAYV